MIEWLRLILMMFYAPLRGMREVRDRGSLAPVALMAFLSQAGYAIVVRRFSGPSGVLPEVSLAGEVLQSSLVLILLALFIVPMLALVANVFDRRGSFRVVITQEYSALASSVLYLLAVVNVASIVIAVGLHHSGIQDQFVAFAQNPNQPQSPFLDNPNQRRNLQDYAFVSRSLFVLPKVVLFGLGEIFVVKDVFRTSVLRAIAIAVIGTSTALVLAAVILNLFSGILFHPFLFFFLFMVLRGYFSDIMGGHRARAAFKQNLESATLNPADASAHYNLGLIHQSRGELEAAKERFERAIQIDEGETDASYQLGRIARQQKRYADAIQNFEKVVMQDPTHSQHEIWREVAATYISAGQFEDARNALDQFLEHRPSDPEGLYLMGRAHAGLGHKREAASLMQACIEAVRTAPAYKYRSSKRWLNEAQQFMKSSL
jgi:tetratricopeptide (TPR) repeat protein